MAKSTADRIRATHARHPSLTQSEIARKIGTSRGAVHAALQRTLPRGRLPATRVRVTLAIDRALLERARAIAEREHSGIGEWIEGCVLATVVETEQQQG